jgi:hypothetical protein
LLRKRERYDATNHEYSHDNFICSLDRLQMHIEMSKIKPNTDRTGRTIDRIGRLLSFLFGLLLFPPLGLVPFPLSVLAKTIRTIIGMRNILAYACNASR